MTSADQGILGDGRNPNKRYAIGDAPASAIAGLQAKTHRPGGGRDDCNTPIAMFRWGVSRCLLEADTRR